jgi:pre-rRNA-processing protein IPI1
VVHNLWNAGDVLEPTILFRIIEVLQSTYKAGNLHITEQLSFLSLLMARFRVHPGSFSTQDNSQKGSNMNTFKSLNRLILNSLSEMGDGSLVLELMWDNLSKEIVRIQTMLCFYVFTQNPLNSYMFVLCRHRYHLYIT